MLSKEVRKERPYFNTPTCRVTSVLDDDDDDDTALIVGINELIEIEL